MKNNPESAEFYCLHICLFNNGKAIHFRTTLTPLRLLFLLSYIEGLQEKIVKRQLPLIEELSPFELRFFFFFF